ncbi:MAG TPA: thiamine-phosphate kinase [Rhodanobacteraceae bacterium]|nr:thiamine-phosphate kinase [Rhodanobacteraceae bacterium]
MEFDLIERVHSHCAHRRGDVALGIGDDAALLDVPAGQQLVACTDTLVAGVHFPDRTAPEDIGWKSLAVNLSDLAAMGAQSAWALLALTLPDADAAFVERFAKGFADLAQAHGVALVGGDTTQGPLSVTVTALGWVPRNLALTRTGARAGDAVFVTGTLGDAAGALRLFLPPQAGTAAIHGKELHGAEGGGGLLRTRLNRPEPRITAGLALRGIASACIDVSDGLLADLGHVCAASKVAAEINADALPISSALAASFDAKTCRELALSGGDDYELCFTAPSARETEVVEKLARTGCGATRIGRVVAGSGVRALDANANEIEIGHVGWEHFS